MRKCTVILLLALILLSGPTAAFGWIHNEYTIPEAIAAADKSVETSPQSAKAQFFRGFAHISLWANPQPQRNQSIAYNPDSDKSHPGIICPWVSVMPVRKSGGPFTQAQLDHLQTAISSYRLAVELQPADTQYRLALAWALEEASSVALTPINLEPAVVLEVTEEERKAIEAALPLLTSADGKEAAKAAQSLQALLPRGANLLADYKEQNPKSADAIDALAKQFWAMQAIEHYAKAYDQTVTQELKLGDYNWEVEKTVSVTAGQRLLILLPKFMPGRPQSDLTQIKKNVETIKAKPMKPIQY
jgi:tetratricopeptide (TPR) repeat protein